MFNENEIQEVKKINVLSLAKIQAIFGFIFGLLAGIFWAIAISWINSSVDYAGTSANAALMRSALPLSGVGAIIILPFLYAIMGFIGGAIIAWIYNLIAGWIGGIELEFKEKKEKEHHASHPQN
jgi:hypothetical protein